jgi:hypothetical protein
MLYPYGIGSDGQALVYQSPHDRESSGGGGDGTANPIRTGQLSNELEMIQVFYSFSCCCLFHSFFLFFLHLFIISLTMK